MNLILLIICLVLWYVFFRYKRRRFYELAALIPALPGRIPFAGVLEVLPEVLPDINKGSVKVIKDITRFAQNNGGLVKLWVGPMLYVGMTNADDMEFILKRHLEKADLVKHIRSVIGNAGIYAPVSMWTRRRKLSIPAFSPKVINSFINVLISHSEHLVEQLSKQNVIGIGKFPAWNFISSYTLDSVCETALGVRFNYLEKPDNLFLKATSKLFFLVTERIFKLWLWPDCIYKLTPQSSEFNKYLKVVQDMTDNIIQKKKEELNDITLDNEQLLDTSTKARCLLEHLILSSKNDAGSGLTNIELREEVLTFLFAGTDTTATSLCNTLLLMAKYPKIQDKVYEEIVNVLGKGNRSLEKSDLMEFKFVDCVLKESLRLFPPAPLLVRKLTEEVILPSGKTLPADTNIVLSVWGVTRDKKYWGPDAECFKPERFASGERTGLFVPFSLGPRNCIGVQYALISMKIVLIAILRRYRVVSDEESGPVPHIEATFTLLFKAVDDYRLALEIR